MLDLASSNHCNDGHIYIQSRVCVCRYLFHRSESLDIDDRLADPWLERYIDVYMYTVIRGPQEHQSLMGEFNLYFRAERRDVLPQLNVHLCCVWRRFN